MNRLLAALALTIAAMPQLRAQAPASQPPWKSGGSWKIRYTFARGQHDFEIRDIAAPGPGRAIAVGWVSEKKGKPEGLAVLTRDGGKNWTEVPLKDLPLSIFFVNDSTGWMVTDGGLWQTLESGLTWRKIGKPKNVDRVCFLDEQHGFGIGPMKTFVRTEDGGKTWKDVEEAKAIKTTEEYTRFNWLEFFGGGKGIVTGASIPPRNRLGELPTWAEPEASSWRRQIPHLSVNLETRDGGKTWKSDTAPIMGIVTRWRSAPDHYALALIRFDMAFEYPSEVYGINTGGGKSLRVFREKNRSVTDVGWIGFRAVLAAVEPPGRVANLPMPGRVHVLESENLKDWHEMPVDWKAYAATPMLAVKGEEAWIATESGMILQLVK